MHACEIRSANDSDAESVAEIYSHYVRNTTFTFEFDPPDRAEILRRMKDVRKSGFPYLVAEVDGRVVGYASAKQFRPRPAYRFTVEDSIYVAAGDEGRGIGHQLLTRLIDDCRNAGAKQMIALMVGENPASVAFHASHGFEHSGTLRSVGFKFERWLDLTLMQRSLSEDTLARNDDATERAPQSATDRMRRGLHMGGGALKSRDKLHDR